MGRPVIAAEVRFDARIEPDLNSGCWLWAAGANRKGYGCFGTGGDKMALAHRYSYQRYIGPIPAGLHVCHRCDTPACVNPAHLFVGTNAENNADKVAKGRHPRGDGAPWRKLSSAIVRMIRTSDLPHTQLARDLGVSAGVICRIRSRHIWRSVP